MLKALNERRTLKVETSHRYPWRDMDVGDEFMFPREIGRRSARMMARAAGDRMGAEMRVVVTKMGIICRRIK